MLIQSLSVYSDYELLDANAMALSQVLQGFDEPIFNEIARETAKELQARGYTIAAA